MDQNPYKSPETERRKKRAGFWLELVVGAVVLFPPSWIVSTFVTPADPFSMVGTLMFIYPFAVLAYAVGLYVGRRN